MSRLAVVCAMLALGCLLVPERVDSAPVGGAKLIPRTDLARRARETQRKLAQVVTIFAMDDPAITLEQLLEQFGVKFSLPHFDFNQKAFKAEKVKGAGATPVAERAIPRINNVRLSTYLHMLLRKVPVPSGAVYVIRGDRIEITTRKAVIAEFYRNRPKKQLAVLPPLIHAAFVKKPLNEALRELSEAANNYNIVVNGNLEESKTPVTAVFHNVPVDNAVELLADMAGLTAVRKYNVLYVTKKKPAQVQRSRIAPNRKKR